jgi:hypothetical protein
MLWLSRQSTLRVTLLALIWPAVLVAWAAAQVAPLLLDNSSSVGFYFVVDTTPWAVAVFFGPSALLLALWRLAKKLRPAAT